MYVHAPHLSGLGQTYSSGFPVQIPYSGVVLLGWSDASGNLSSTWQGFYLAKIAGNAFPPILQPATILSNSGTMISAVVTDAAVYALVTGNKPATPAAGIMTTSDPFPTMTGTPAVCTTDACRMTQSAGGGLPLIPGAVSSVGSNSLFGLSTTQLLIGAAVLVGLWMVSK